MQVLEFDKHLKKAGGHRNNNKGEDNSPKTLNDKNLGQSYNKQIYIYYFFYIFNNMEAPLRLRVSYINVGR